MSDVCRELRISRKTGYKISNRYRQEGHYRQEGVEALCDHSQRPVRYANQLSKPVEQLIIETKRDKPHWGARKIREVLVRSNNDPPFASPDKLHNLSKLSVFWLRRYGRRAHQAGLLATERAS